MSEIEEVKQLTPEERIRRLKEIEEERKGEIEEAETLIRESMREISEASEKKHAPIRQVTAHDISQLLTTEEKRMFKTARFQDLADEKGREATEEGTGMQNLEEVAAEEAREKQQHQSHAPIYGKALDEARKGVDYGARTTAGAGRMEGVQEVYSSRTVTGAQDKPGQMYERGREAAGEISGSYERRKEEEEKKRRSDWRI